MMETATSQSLIIDIKDLGFDRGAHLLVKRALMHTPVGERVGIKGRAPELAVHLRGWCRSQGHEIVWPDTAAEKSDLPPSDDSPLIAWIIRGSAVAGRWSHAETAGAPDPRLPGAVVDHPPQTWGLAARGAKVEAGGPPFTLGLPPKQKCGLIVFRGFMLKPLPRSGIQPQPSTGRHPLNFRRRLKRRSCRS